MDFKLEDEHFVRVPYFKESEWNKFINKKDGHNNHLSSINTNTDYILSSLILSSVNFFENLNNFELKNDRKKNSVVKALENYFYRMTYKQAPFGFFSTIISSSQFKKTGINEFMEDISFLRKQNSHIELSKEFYINVINKIQKEKCILNRLKIKKSNYILKKLNYISKVDYDLLSDYEIIGVNNFLNELLYLCEELQDIDYIVRKLKEKYSLEPKEILEIILILIKQDILITDIHPIITNYDWRVLVSKLEDTDYTNSLNEIILKIGEINELKTFPPTEFIALITQCKELCESSQYIVGNSIIKNEQSSLINKKEFSESIEEIIPYLLVTFNKEIDELNKYTDNFYELYGESYVPFLRVISECGIFDYMESDSMQSNNIAINKIIEGIRCDKNIKLNISDFEEIKEREKKYLEQIPDLQLFTNLNFIDDQHYLNIDTGVKVRNKGAFEGRLQTKLNTIINSDLYILEYNYISSDLKLNNVLGESSDINNIDLKDIYVYWEDNRLNLYSRKLKRRILIRKNNMVNFKYLPSFLKMLYTISNQITWSGFYNDILNKFDYVPRITYKNIILSLKTWRLLESDLNYTSFVEKIEYLNTEFLMPNRIIIYFGDDKYPLNISRDFDINKCYELYKRFGYLVIKEDTRKNFNDYSIDFVLNFKNNLFNYQQQGKAEKVFLPNVITNKENGALNNNWLYFEIFVDPIEQNNVLKQMQKEFSNNKFFFVRYFNEEEETLRIRFKIYNINEGYNLLKDVCTYLNSNIKNKIIKKYNINSYEREISYFGSEDNLSKLEDYFLLESEFIINNLITETDYDNKQTLIVFYIVSLLNTLNVDMYPVKIKQSSKDLYRYFKIDLIQFHNSNSYRDIQEIIQKIVNHSDIHTLYIDEFLIKKLIHLFINRSLGFNERKEKIIIDIVKQFMTTLNYLSENQEVGVHDGDQN